MYKPTAHIIWVRAYPDDPDSFSYGKVIAYSNSKEFGKEAWRLKQLWVSDTVGEEDEWRDIEMAP